MNLESGHVFGQILREIKSLVISRSRLSLSLSCLSPLEPMEAQRAQQAAGGDDGHRKPRRRGNGAVRKAALRGRCITCNGFGHHWKQCRNQCAHCQTRDHPERACPQKGNNYYQRNGYDRLPAAPPMALAGGQPMLAPAAPQAAPAHQAPAAPFAPPPVRPPPAPPAPPPEDPLPYETTEAYVARVQYQTWERAYADGYRAGYETGSRGVRAMIVQNLATADSKFIYTIQRSDDALTSVYSSSEVLSARASCASSRPSRPR